MAEKIYWSQHSPIQRRTMELVGSGTDRSLSSEGIDRAHLMGRRFLTLVESEQISDLSGVIFTSPLSRALTTSEIIARYLGFQIEVRQELRAQHFGMLEGKTKDEILEVPHLAKHLHSNLQPSELLTDKAPGGESVQNAYDRMRSTREELFDSHEGNPIVITHGSILKTLVGSVCERPVEEWGGITREFKNRLVVDDYANLTSIDYL